MFEVLQKHLLDFGISMQDLLWSKLNSDRICSIFLELLFIVWYLQKYYSFLAVLDAGLEIVKKIQSQFCDQLWRFSRKLKYFGRQSKCQFIN